MKTIILKTLFAAIAMLFLSSNAIYACSANINGSTSVCPGSTERYYVNITDSQILSDVQHQLRVTRGRFANGQTTMNMTAVGSAISFDVTWNTTGSSGYIFVTSTYNRSNGTEVRCTDSHYIGFRGRVSSISSSFTSCNGYRLTANGASGPYEWQITGGSITGSTTGRTVNVRANSANQSVTARVRSTACGSGGQWTTRTLTNHRYYSARINGPGTMVCRSFSQGYFSLGSTSHITRVAWSSTSSGGGSLSISSPSSRYGTNISGFRPNNMYSINARLYCGNTLVRTVSKTVVTGLSCKVDSETAGLSYSNYPNPFDRQTTIEFSIPDDENVTLKITDAMGRVVAVLLNDEQKAAGKHEVIFDAASYPTGMYYYTIQAGEYVGTQKMLLTK